MKITIYELLGMIKDGKAPKKIKFKNNDWYWENDIYIPYSFLDSTPDVQISTSLFRKYRIDYCLNDEVEIIEEELRDIEVCGSLFTKSEYDKLAHSEEEKKIPEKLKIKKRMVSSPEMIGGMAYPEYYYDNVELGNKINEIIDYLDYFKNKGDE